MLRATLLVWTLLAAPALAQSPETSLASMLRAVPAPKDIQELMDATPIVAYIRLDLLAGVRGPASELGTTRLSKLLHVFMPALERAGMINSMALADLWPQSMQF